jgi:HSP20 family protein
MTKAKDLLNVETEIGPLNLRDVDEWYSDLYQIPFAALRLPKPRSFNFDDINPVTDMFEESDDLVLRAEIPGIKKEDIEVTITENTISISGEKKKETEAKRKNYYKWESSYGSFCRTFRLPKEVQLNKVKSSFKNGILEIRMPKSEEAKSKEVKVKIE